MTILAVALGAQGALVAADTGSEDLVSGRHVHATKLFVLSHINAILAGRGTMALPLFTYAHVLGATSFDRLAQVDMPVVLRQGVETTMEAARLQGVESFLLEPVNDFRLTLTGYSQERGAWACWDYRYIDGRIDGEPVVGFVEPWQQAWGDVPTPSTKAELIDVAHLQARHARATSPGANWGGSLIIAELSRDRVAIEHAGSL